MRTGKLGAIMLGIILVIVVILLFMCTTRVPAGYVAVQYNMNGGVKDEILTQGWHLVSPTIHTTNYTVGIEQSYLTSGSQGDSKEDESFYACSSEGKDMKIDLTFTYQFDADKVAQVFTQFKGQSGKEVRDSFVKPNIISWVKEGIAKYRVADVLGAKRAEVNRSLTDYLAERFEPYGIMISNVSLINIEVDDDTANAINAKIMAQQNAETQAINNQTNIDKAEAEAQVRLTEAQAKADAMLIEANAEAEANSIVAASLTNTILDKIKLEQWNGELPTVMGSSNPIINIP